MNKKGAALTAGFQRSLMCWIMLNYFLVVWDFGRARSSSVSLADILWGE